MQTHEDADFAGRQPKTPFEFARLEQNVDMYILPGDYEDWGTIEGNLLEVSLVNQPTFRVFDDLTGRGIECRFDDSQLSLVKDALHHRVSVYGRVRYNRLGEPVVINVEEFEKIMEKPVQQISIDLTGGMDSGEYVKRLRDEQ